MTKTKLAKLAAKSASAKSEPPPPLLKFNRGKTSFTFNPGEGAPGQLATELDAFNNSKWTASQQAAHQAVQQTFLGQQPLPSFSSIQTIDTPVHYNPATAVENYFATVNHDAFMDPSSDTNYQATLTFSDIEDLDVFVPQVEQINPQEVFLPDDETLNAFNAEVLRQTALNKEIKDGLNDFFDFTHFE